MTFTESAKLIDAQEIRAIVGEVYTNPTVERLMFVETREKDDQPGKVFPCYIEEWSTENKEENGVELEWLVFTCCILQCVNGEFAMVRVHIREGELGIKTRFWDKPPKKDLRDETPWLDSGVVQ